MSYLYESYENNSIASLFHLFEGCAKNSMGSLHFIADWKTAKWLRVKPYDPKKLFVLFKRICREDHLRIDK